VAVRSAQSRRRRFIARRHPRPRRDGRQGRRVFLDFRSDPRGDGRLTPFEPRQLGPEAYGYLERSGALMATPIARLRKMNPPAVALYRSHGIDLAREPLEIAVCAQHNNGGFRASICGNRASAAFSRRRGLRHARRHPRADRPSTPARSEAPGRRSSSPTAARAGPFGRRVRPGAEALVLEKRAMAEAMLKRGSKASLTPAACVAEVRRRMSACGAVVRNPADSRGKRPAAGSCGEGPAVSSGRSPPVTLRGRSRPWTSA